MKWGLLLIFSQANNCPAQDSHILHRYPLDSPVRQLQWLGHNKIMVQTQKFISIIDTSWSVKPQILKVTGNVKAACISNNTLYYATEDKIKKEPIIFLAFRSLSDEKEYVLHDGLFKFTKESGYYSIDLVTASTEAKMIVFGLALGTFLTKNTGKWFVYSIPDHKEVRRLSCVFR